MATALEEILAIDEASAPIREGFGQKSYRHMYWRKTDGWITIGPSWGEEYKRLIRKGYQPLDKFGEFLLTSRHQTRPFHTLLERGGAVAFSVDQLKALGWHRPNRTPKINGRPVRFPQLDGLEIVEFQCAVCKKLYLSEHDLHRHESIAHKEHSSQMALSRKLAEATSGVMSESLGELLTLMVQQQSAMAERQARTDALLAAIIERVAPELVNKEEAPAEPKAEPTPKKAK